MISRFYKIVVDFKAREGKTYSESRMINDMLFELMDRAGAENGTVFMGARGAADPYVSCEIRDVFDAGKLEKDIKKLLFNEGMEVKNY